MPGKFILSLMDYSKETSRMGVHIPTMQAGNIAAVDALMDTLSSAVDGVTLGTITKDQRVAEIVTNAAIPPASKTAQVELKWEVKAVDASNGRPVSFSIPTADPSFVTNNTDLMDINDGAQGEALKDAVEALVLSIDGNAITIVEVRLVGRNL